MMMGVGWGRQGGGGGRRREERSDRVKGVRSVKHWTDAPLGTGQAAPPRHTRRLARSLKSPVYINASWTHCAYLIPHSARNEVTRLIF